mmetsp:Transcript_23932/g.57042  ORF Transcript_23932/g.57042 Transcript_23932/m.57042 type:complete len:514 (+) Transcript_23932:287-1828(+)
MTFLHGWKAMRAGIAVRCSSRISRSTAPVSGQIKSTHRCMDPTAIASPAGDHCGLNGRIHRPCRGRAPSGGEREETGRGVAVGRARGRRARFSPAAGARGHQAAPWPAAVLCGSGGSGSQSRAEAPHRVVVVLDDVPPREVAAEGLLVDADGVVEGDGGEAAAAAARVARVPVGPVAALPVRQAGQGLRLGAHPADVPDAHVAVRRRRRHQRPSRGLHLQAVDLPVVQPRRRSRLPAAEVHRPDEPFAVAEPHRPLALAAVHGRVVRHLAAVASAEDAALEVEEAEAPVEARGVKPRARRAPREPRHKVAVRAEEDAGAAVVVVVVAAVAVTWLARVPEAEVAVLVPGGEKEPPARRRRKPHHSDASRDDLPGVALLEAEGLPQRGLAGAVCRALRAGAGGLAKGGEERGVGLVGALEAVEGYLLDVVDAEAVRLGFGGSAGVGAAENHVPAGSLVVDPLRGHRVRSAAPLPGRSPEDLRLLVVVLPPLAGDPTLGWGFLPGFLLSKRGCHVR